MKDAPPKQGLILVNIQNDYIPGGRFELVAIEQAAENARRLLRRFREQQSAIVHIQHISKQPGATFFLPGTEGAEIHESAAPYPDETVIVKHFPNSFRDTHLLQHLKECEVEKVILCGAMSHMCIDATTRAALDFGLQCVVIGDACATRDLKFESQTVEATEVHAAFMAALATGYANIVSTIEFEPIH